MFVQRGCPKSLFRPGSSTTLLLFEKNRIHFAEDLLQNQTHPTAESRFSLPFGRTLVETDVKVRSAIAYAWSVPRCDTIHNQQEFPHP